MKWFIPIASALMLTLCGCAGSNPLTASHGNAGFFSGLWHGMICPIALVISWFNHNVSIYEVHNNGAWYNIGFVLGAGAWGILRKSGNKRLADYSDDEIRAEAERRGQGGGEHGEAL